MAAVSIVTRRRGEAMPTSYNPFRDGCISSAGDFWPAPTDSGNPLALEPATDRAPAAGADDAGAPWGVGGAQREMNLHFHVAAGLRLHPQVTAAVADQCLER